MGYSPRSINFHCDSRQTAECVHDIGSPCYIHTHNYDPGTPTADPWGEYLDHGTAVTGILGTYGNSLEIGKNKEGYWTGADQARASDVTDDPKRP